MPDARDLRSNELEGRLRQLHPADELGYRFLYRESSPHCRRDPAWSARIAELQSHLDENGLARALALAAERGRTLPGQP
jgi:hypothetical protein